MFKKLLAGLLSATIVMSSVSTVVFAEEAEPVQQEEQVVVEEVKEEVPETPAEEPVVEEPEEEEVKEDTPVVASETQEEKKEEVKEEEKKVEEHNEDTVAPVINSVSVDGSSYNVGDTVTVSFDITEEDTGISSAYVTFSSVEEDSHVQIAADISGSSLSGTYYGTYTIPSSMRAGEWTTTYAYASDKVGNTSSKMMNNAVSFNVVNTEEKDTTAPNITSWGPKNETVTLDDGNSLLFSCSDKDICSVTFRIGCLDGGVGRNITSSITPNESGEYEVPFTFNSSDFTGNWVITNLYFYDTNGNRKAIYTSKNFTVTEGNTKEEEHDTQKPVITSVSASKTDIETPDYATVTVKGTENTIDSTVNVSIALGNSTVNNGTKYFSGSAVVDKDGNWSTDIEVSFPKDMKASNDWKIYYVSATDSSSNKKESYEDYVVFNVKTSNKSVSKEVSLSSSEAVDQIKEAKDGSTILVNADTKEVPASIFEAIQGTSKTLVFNLDGIQWIFKGSDITNPKAIDLSVSLDKLADISEYGYAEGTEGVRLNFAPNGVLPGKADVRIKSNYISKLYNLNSDLYLAFIKSTAEVEEEITYTDYVYPTDEDGNTIYEVTTYLYDEDDNPIEYTDEETFEELEEEYPNLKVDEETNQLYYTEEVTPEEVEKTATITKTVDSYTQIEDANIKLEEDGYVTITLTHNSSYILTGSLPVAAKCTAKKVVSTKKDTTTVATTTSNTNNTSSASTGSVSVPVAANTTTAVASTSSTSTATNNAVTTNTETTKATTSNSTATEVKSNATSKKLNKYAKVSGSTNSIKVTFNNKKYKGYEIKYSTNKNMKKSKSVSSTSSKTIKNLSANKKYYCKVRFYKVNKNGKKVYTGWRTFTVHTA